VVFFIPSSKDIVGLGRNDGAREEFCLSLNTALCPQSQR